MDQTTEIQMLNALEFFHYSCRFQKKLFILSIESGIELENIITDLRILNAAKIKIIVICWNQKGLKETLNSWSERGCPLLHVEPKEIGEHDENWMKNLEDLCEKDIIPVIGLSAENSLVKNTSKIDEYTIALSQLLSTDKIFFLSHQTGLYIDEQFYSHLTPQLALQSIQKGSAINIGEGRFQRLVKLNLDFGIEIVLLEGKGGCLFREIFTHRGDGTLITNDYPNLIRKGMTSDVLEISLLLKPYMSSGAILPIKEDEIATDVSNYYVYTVNNSIVAISKLTDYGSATELAKFSTLPRYQGKGRARELAVQMIKTAKKAEKDYIFALSVEPKMFAFFKSLGFNECKREDLPAAWQENYDMMRPSKAFRYFL